MSQQTRTKDLSKYPYEVNLEACPTELLKSVQSLKQMGMTSAVVELSFKTISELEIFTRILNREQDEQRVANELKVTYFHNVRGKIKRTQMTKNEQFNTMKKIRFNSAYHATLFLKYYQDRIRQLENEYRYTITNGRQGYLYVYLNDDDTISSMFINEIRDMKKRLNFLQMKEYEVCERFRYSDRLGEQLQRIGLFNEIWYRGKDSTMIFYSENQSLSKMKRNIEEVTRYHITILKMIDNRFPFLVNYFLFQQLKKLMWPEVRKLDSVEMSQLEFNQNKAAVVIHDMHEVFSAQIKQQILEKMKNFVLITYRAKFARGFFNWLKKNFFFDESLSFSYSKKTVCMCINLEKVRSYDDIRKIFSSIGQSINFKSQITFNWLHLQDYTLYEYRKQLALRIISLLSSSAFYIQNYEQLALNKDLKCVLKLKNATMNNLTVSGIVSDAMTKCIAVWNNKQLIGKNFVEVEKDKMENVEINKFEDALDDADDYSDSQESQYDEGEAQDDENQKYNENADENAKGKQKGNPHKQNKNYSKKNEQNQPGVDEPEHVYVCHGFQQKNGFTQKLISYIKDNDPKYYKSESTSDLDLEWKVDKCWRNIEDDLLSETKIHSRIKKVQMNCNLKDKFDAILQKIRKNPQQTAFFFHNFDSYSPIMYKSPFYKPNQDKRIQTFNDFKPGHKFVICCEMIENNLVLSFPVCSLEVLKKF